MLTLQGSGLRGLIPVANANNCATCHAIEQLKNIYCHYQYDSKLFKREGGEGGRRGKHSDSNRD